jgi:hypothetical protein
MNSLVDREKFMAEFYQLSDFFNLVQMFDLIELILTETKESRVTIKERARLGMSVHGDCREACKQLSDLYERTRAWPVKCDDGAFRIERRIGESVVLNDGWEFDNLAWVTDDGSQRKLWTTSHGGECEMSQDMLVDKVAETQKSLDGLMKLATLMRW